MYLWDFEADCELSFSHFSSSFEPIFALYSRGNINNCIFPLKHETKIGQNNPEKRRTLNSQATSSLQYSTFDLKNLCTSFDEFKVLDFNLLIFSIEDN
jgi:hypothetical protein